MLGETEDSTLVGQLVAIRDEGFAVSHDELEEGVVGIAAPIFSPRGLVTASIGVVAPAGRLQTAGFVANVIVSAAASIGRKPISTSST